MKHFDVWVFIQRAADFGRAEALGAMRDLVAPLGVPTALWDETLKATLGDAPGSPDEVKKFKDLAQYCRDREMSSSAAFIERMAEATAGSKAALFPMLPELQRRLEDEFRGTFLLHLPKWQAGLYEKAHLFGEKVSARFPSAQRDVREAGTCLATDRATACVFHLMRALESPLAVLKARFGIRTKSDNWDQIIRPIDKTLKRTDFKRRPWWKKDEQFYGEVSNRLHALKLSRRNPTIHLRADEHFDVPAAAVVMNDVRAFMVHLAAKLRERGVR